MTYDEYSTGIHYLRRTAGLVLPYNLMPGSKQGGEIPITSEAEHEDYGWNPPGNFVGNAAFPGYQDADPDASDKPTYAAIERAAGRGQISLARSLLQGHLRKECKRRITLGYGEREFDDEIAVRLRGATTQAQDAERDRLLGKYRERRDWINDAGTELGELQDFDVTADQRWT